MEISAFGIIAICILALLVIGLILVAFARLLSTLPKQLMSKEDGTIYQANCTARIDSIAANFPLAEVKVKNNTLIIKIIREYIFQIDELADMQLKTRWGMSSLKIQTKGPNNHRIQISGCNCSLLKTALSKIREKKN